MRVEVDSGEVFKKTADNRGRITLGTKYSGKTLEVAVLSEVE